MGAIELGDRELLELAAKAAGIAVDGYGMEYQSDGPFGDVVQEGMHTTGGIWNPLTDDGDALRLASALLIDIEWETEWVVFASGNFSEDIKDHGNDRAAATRRAIVRAAAFEAQDD